MNLAEQNCRPVKKDEHPFTEQEVNTLVPQIPGWSLSRGQLSREFRFKDFREAMDFVNRVAGIANAQDHHPDICISYATVLLTLSTHKINGLSMNDFIIAAKIDVITAASVHGKAV